MVLFREEPFSFNCKTEQFPNSFNAVDTFNCYGRETRIDVSHESDFKRLRLSSGKLAASPRIEFIFVLSSPL